MIVYLDGEFIDHAQARVSVDDRGFLFADGVYEVIRSVAGEMFLFDAHLTRMREGLAALRIDRDAFPDPRPIAERLLTDNGLTAGEATIYLQVTRGVAPRKHSFPAADTPPTRYAAAKPLPPHSAAYFERGVSAVTVPDTRWTRCDIKSVSLLPNVLANQQAKDAGAFEALFVRDGAVIEGSHANLFAVIDDELRTYPACNYILAGITRAVVIDVARQEGIPFREVPVYSNQLAAVSELFLSGTTTDVMPITTLDGEPVGDGRPGPVSVRMLEALRARMGGPGVTAGPA